MQPLDLDKSIMENMVANINQSSDVVFTTAHLTVSDPTPIPVPEGQSPSTMPFHNTIVSIFATEDSPVPGNKNVRYHRLHLDYDFGGKTRTFHILTGKTDEEIVEIIRLEYALHVDSTFTGEMTTTNSVNRFKLTADELDLLYCGDVTVTVVFI